MGNERVAYCRDCSTVQRRRVEHRGGSCGAWLQAQLDTGVHPLTDEQADGLGGDVAPGGGGGFEQGPGGGL